MHISSWSKLTFLQPGCHCLWTTRQSFRQRRNSTNTREEAMLWGTKARLWTTRKQPWGFSLRVRWMPFLRRPFDTTLCRMPFMNTILRLTPRAGPYRYEGRGKLILKANLQSYFCMGYHGQIQMRAHAGNWIVSWNSPFPWALLICPSCDALLWSECTK